MPQETLDLFATARGVRLEPLAPDVVALRGHALGMDCGLLEAVAQISAAAPFRHLSTRGGFQMSVAMTNCGRLGWYSDRRGYRYEACDPLTGAPWPEMPAAFLELASTAAAAAGFAVFEPDACLINRYVPGSRMTLHQDKDEADFRWPIVSVSLGLPAVFLLGGDLRGDRTVRVPLQHGDVVVWGGAARLRHHGVLAVKPGQHPRTGAARFNLTFRRAG